MIKIAPSILSADFARLGEAVEALNLGGADWIHFDVMDGNFVPNITFGPATLRALRPLSRLPMDVHLMVENPAFWIEPFHAAGADIITFHLEADRHANRTLAHIRSLGMKAGVVLNPSTPVCMAESVLPYCDLILLMSVNPGFGGQRFIPNTPEKIAALRDMLQRGGCAAEIEIDGGVNPETARLCTEAGADILVAGSAVFTAENPSAMIRLLRGENQSNS
ncbi:MAG: ribulose-phosphate 3-epimerase [Clostridia bacterium]|nr:ribulose-phosphate 3-epimerase [Clostridia bacterium]